MSDTNSLSFNDEEARLFNKGLGLFFCKDLKQTTKKVGSKMEQTSRQKDKMGIQRYGICGDSMEALKEGGAVNRNETIRGENVLSVLINSYLFASNDGGETWTGPHIGKPDLDATFKRYCIAPLKIDPIRK